MVKSWHDSYQVLGWGSVTMVRLVVGIESRIDIFINHYLNLVIYDRVSYNIGVVVVLLTVN